MEKILQNNYLTVSYEKELEDSKKLVKMIIESGWVAPDMVIVNCQPEYSSRLSQFLNHKLSYLNKNELYECINLEIPYPIMSQVWDAKERNFQFFDKYLPEWVRQNISTSSNYLFVTSVMDSRRNYGRLLAQVSSKLESEYFKFASLYSNIGPVNLSDFCVQDIEQGVAFEWENLNNPNWNY